jgi:hypothetical protein
MNPPWQLLVEVHIANLHVSPGCAGQQTMWSCWGLRMLRHPTLHMQTIARLFWKRFEPLTLLLNDPIRPFDRQQELSKLGG